MDHLPLQVREIHDVEIHQADAADAGRGEVQAQRRAQPARADQQHLRALQLELPFHADFRHDQVAAVAQDLVLRKRGLLVGQRRHRPAGDAGHDRDRVAILHRRRVLLHVADVFVVQIHVDEAAQLAFIVIEMAPEFRVLRW